jgi:predicted O-linked N-acetylglucosamine transferase (SPINDLY family)
MSEVEQLPQSKSIQEIQALLNSNQVEQVIGFCESQITFPILIAGPIHWLYGLALLLNGQEEDAQSVWMIAMASGEDAQVAEWVAELAAILDLNAVFRAEQTEWQSASLIRQHIRELLPDDENNFLQLIKLELLQEKFTLHSFLEFEILDRLKTEVSSNAFSKHKALLLEILQLYLNSALAHEVTIKFVAALRPYIDPEEFVQVVFSGAFNLGHVRGIPKLAGDLLELCVELNPYDTEVLVQLSEMLLVTRVHTRVIEVAQNILDYASDPITKALGSYYMLKAYLNDGKDRGATLKVAQDHEVHLKILIDCQPDLSYSEARYLLVSVHLLTYINDNPPQHRTLQNQIVAMCTRSIRDHWAEKCEQYSHRIINQSPLRIGYISSCFYCHSVGWLARTLMQHHDPQKFEIYIYAVNTPDREHPVKAFYERSTPNYRACGVNSGEIADLIHQDNIDILIDLDSITRDSVCTVMALKPAPIQATWMGWDAVGTSSIDYYIADNYSLPENAQDYYVEKIWRLPQTFLAVDGFEVGIPTVNRRDLDIPEDAIVFLNPQRGFKLTPEVLKLQLQILKATPNSYLLLKGIAEEALQQSLGQLAQDVNVSLDRIRPIPYAPSEEIHRANLAIADIILDTFPYNGATTTMEALWMERPIVTLVGQQFSARNSYTMMMNAGITEGISWTPEEYVAWGIRLGTEPELRQQVAWKLRQGKQSAPLWNGKAFAQQMEAAYTEMYQIYVDRSVMPQIARE